jgi:hypothetical protein
VLARPKVSYAPPQPHIWITRRGYEFKHFLATKPDPEAEARARADQVERYLISQLAEGARHTKTDLESAGILPQKKLRAALSSLLVAGRVVYKPLPEEQRHGGRKEYLHPVAATPSSAGATGDGGAQKDPPTPSAEDPASTPSSPYREKIDDGVDVANFSQQACHSGNEGQRGSNGVDGVGAAEGPIDPPAGFTKWPEDFHRRAAREPGYDKDAEPQYCCMCRNRAKDKRCLAWAQLGAPEGWKPADKAPRRCRGFTPT